MFHACVTYIICDTFYTKYYLGKPRKNHLRVTRMFGGIIYIGLKELRYERELTGTIYIILISCSLCDVAMQVCLPDSLNVLMSRVIDIL